MPEARDETIVEASPIWNERLYMGSFPLSGVDLSSDGFDLLVICAVERMYLLGNPSERETGELFRCTTLHTLFDDGPVTEDVVREAIRGAQRTADVLRSGGKVLVTCNAGRNRSGLVIALAMLALFPAMTSADVIRLIQKRRVTPDGARALTNTDFVDFIQGRYGRARSLEKSNG